VLDWRSIGTVGLALLISPLLGFLLSFILYRIVARMSRDPRLYDLEPGQAPPLWLRGILTVTCAGVSFTHGSNDGQKTIGLFMLILMSLAPTIFAIDSRLGAPELARATEAAGRLEAHLRQRADEATAGAATAAATPADRKQVGEWARSLLRVTEHVPDWVMLMSAMCLSIGTMVGWKRIVTTVGEKIAKTELSPAQGGAAEAVAMATISLADFGGMPVSTTHVLSSGVAGTMIARGSGIQPATVRNMALAWIFTLPTTMVLSALFFYVLTYLL